MRASSRGSAIDHEGMLIHQAYDLAPYEGASMNVATIAYSPPRVADELLEGDLIRAGDPRYGIISIPRIRKGTAMCP